MPGSIVSLGQREFGCGPGSSFGLIQGGTSMPVFRDTRHLYQVLGALFERVAAEPAIASRLLLLISLSALLRKGAS